MPTRIACRHFPLAGRSRGVPARFIDIRSGDHAAASVGFQPTHDVGAAATSQHIKETRSDAFSRVARRRSGDSESGATNPTNIAENCWFNKNTKSSRIALEMALIVKNQLFKKAGKEDANG
ncbi:hypothetical protein [Caballeronia pedi]|uniref:hypothetical protein n=1 Tax=Caballeronia pedi TaxID=1777141 RepID=UPI0011785A7B|nr:hypothetical protein [Caballeronia pedi]